MTVYPKQLRKENNINKIPDYGLLSDTPIQTLVLGFGKVVRSTVLLGKQTRLHIADKTQAKL